MKVLLLFGLIGIVVCNPHCRVDGDCPNNYCSYPDYPYCEEGDCNCRNPCKKDSDCESDNTNDLQGNQCRHSPRYCVSGHCHCGSDHLQTSDGTCPTGHTAECHGIICSGGTHLSCLNHVCTCQSYASSGGCTSSSQCHSLTSCPRIDHHCIDGKCMCAHLTAPATSCSGVSECASVQCSGRQSAHCLDGTCKCI